MSGTTDPDAPVLVGTGAAAQRLDDPSGADEPLALMARALRDAADDAGLPGGGEQLLRRLGRIAVPKGRWEYGDPARLLARQVGADGATTVLAEVGVLQQTLIADAVRRVADGEVEVAAVVGGEAGHRLRVAAKAGVEVADTADDGRPDVHLVPDEELLLDAETRPGLNRPINLYAVLESAYRHRRGLGVDASRDRIAAMYARFSEIAATNPEAWHRSACTPDDIRDEGPRNPMLAFPYTRAHASSWSVDQAGALLLCSAAVADELGIPAERRTHPVASAESNAMSAVSARGDLGDSPGARAVSRAVLEHAGVGGADLDLVELYSCFPVAVELFAEALGVPDDRDLTVTGGMPWAGGPFNNYVLQATHTLVRRLRASGGRGVVSSVSGLMTKQAAAIWSAEPPARPFADEDVTARVEKGADEHVVVAVDDLPEQEAAVVGHTVLHIPDRPLRSVAVLELSDGRRTVARTESEAVAAAMETEDWCGRTVTLGQHGFTP